MRYVDTDIRSIGGVPPEKTAIAQEILIGTDIALSMQVLQATHVRRPDALPHDIVTRLIEKSPSPSLQPPTANGVTLRRE